jgi:adenylate kinase family enzyme
MKIMVTGNAGSGKSTMAKILSYKYDLSCSSLDGIVWQEGWKKTPAEQRKAKITKLTTGKSWVIDGVDYEVMYAADTVIFLDYPRRVCFYRAFKRNVPYLFSSRPELPENCPEIMIVPQLIKIIWNFPKRVRPKLLAVGTQNAQRFVHIHNNRELRAYLVSL